METFSPPTKRLKVSPPLGDTAGFNTNSDFVSLGSFDHEEDHHNQSIAPLNAPTGSRQSSNGHQQPRRIDPRNRFDRPKSKHAIPGFESWVLVKTRFGRRFVHNIKTEESFWRIPKDVLTGVQTFDLEEEKRQNSKWAEEQLEGMRKQPMASAESNAGQITTEGDGRSRRRRSESLQREDEAAMLAELEAETERAEEHDAAAAAKAVAPLDPQSYVGEASDSEYEYVEVTDTTGEEDEDGEGSQPGREAGNKDDAELGQQEEQQVDDPVEFGEDDIAYQLAMMGESYGLDPGEYTAGHDVEEEYEEGAEGLPLTVEDATALFREMLDEHGISPFTPWDKLIGDVSESSIVLDDRYTVFPSTKARKDVWDQWSRIKAAEIKEQRAKEVKKDPRIPYLAFLARRATPKLYWPEFKRKFKREPELNDRSLQEKDREKIYRDFIARLKLPESKRKDDLKLLLKSLNLTDLNRETSLEALPIPLLTSLPFYVVPASTRDVLLTSHVASLPSAPVRGNDKASLESRTKVEKQLKRDAALLERERQVEEERRHKERDNLRARRDLRDSERELEAAMRVRRNGVKPVL